MAKLTFPEKTASYDFRLGTVVFQANDDDFRRIRCTIGAKPLQDHFGARGRSQQELMAAFQRGIQQVHQAADRKYQALGGKLAELELTSRDFEAGSALELGLAKHLREQTTDGPER